MKKSILILLTIIFCVGTAISSYAFNEKESPQYTSIGDFSIHGEAGINPLPYLNYNNVLNCHFYTWGRAYETNGISLPSNIRLWYTDKDVHSEPRENSIALWGGPGHITHSAYIESVDGDMVTFSEGGYLNIGYHYGTQSLDTLNHWSSEPLWGFVYLDLRDEHTVQSTLNVKTTTADHITATDATIRGHIDYSGERPSEFGVYFGVDKEHLEKVGIDPTPEFASTSFPIWYPLNEECGVFLEPSTNYFWQAYAIQSGKEIRGNIETFRTIDSVNQLTVTTTTVDNITQNDATVRGTVFYTGEKPSEYGLFLGTSRSNMKIVATDPEPDFALNPYPVWYPIIEEADYTLRPGTKYFCCVYAKQNGKIVKGEIITFKTLLDSLDIFDGGKSFSGLGNPTKYK